MIHRTLVENLIILNRARKTGNISKTCREFGMSRASYYHIRNAVKNFVLQKARLSDGAATPETIIKNMVLANPGFASTTISEKLLNDHNIQISHTTVHAKLKELNLNRGEQRWQYLENQLKYNTSKQQLNVQQRLFMQKHNPCFSAYHYNIDGRPFTRLNIDVIKAGPCRVCIAIDPINNYAFALTLSKTNRKQIVEWLDTQVFSKAVEFGLPVKTVATSSLNLFDENLNGESDYYAFSDLLQKHNLQRIDQLASKPMLDGAVQHVYERLLPLLNTFYSKQTDEQVITKRLTSWLEDYNNCYAYSYYPNYGLSPAAVMYYYLNHGENWRGYESLVDQLRGYISPMQALRPRKVRGHGSSVYSSLVALLFR